MNGRTNDSPEAARERLEEEADQTRARLLDELDTLDERRHRLREFFAMLRDGAKQHRKVLIAAGAGTLVACAVIALRRRAKARQPETRFAALLGRVLGPGYVVESVEQRRGFVRSALTRAGTTLAGTLGSELGKRAVARWLDSDTGTGSEWAVIEEGQTGT